MQIRGLHRSIYRGASLASRLEAKERSEEAHRRDAVARWRQAHRDGLSVAAAARAVGHSLAKLYRWEKQPRSRSKRPRSPRRTTWTTELVQAVEHLRLEEPMWGKAKLVVKLREQGFKVSEATIGRIIAHLVARGAVEPVPCTTTLSCTLRSGRSFHWPRYIGFRPFISSVNASIWAA